MSLDHQIEFTRTAKKIGSQPECLTWYMNYMDVHLAHHFLPDHNISWFEINGRRVEQDVLANVDLLASIHLVKRREQYLSENYKNV